MKGVPPIVRLAICRWFRENADTDTAAKAGMTPGCFQLTRKREQSPRIELANWRSCSSLDVLETMKSVIDGYWRMSDFFQKLYFSGLTCFFFIMISNFL